MYTFIVIDNAIIRMHCVMVDQHELNKGSDGQYDKQRNKQTK